MPTAYSYERVSSGLQAEKGRGLERQAIAAEAWCATHGLELDESLRLTDAGLSAYKGDHLKGALGRFLQLAEKGELGESPVLLVEAIDRLSRLEAIDGLQDVLLALVRSGVSIVTLEDGAEYSRKTLREDGSKLIILVVKCQSAWEYSRRLSRRVTAAWKQTLADLENGVLRRAEFFCPPWCSHEDGQIKIIPEKAEIVRKVFNFALEDGDKAVASRLEEERTPTLTGSPKWTRTMVRKLLFDSRVWGAVSVNQMERRSVADRERLKAAGKDEQVFPDLLPLVMPKEEVDLVLARRASRSHPGSSSGRRGQTWNIASGMTRCSCGAAASLATTQSGSPRMVNGERLKLRYLRCSARCGAKGYRLEALNGHLLTRLHDGQLQQMLAAESGRGEQVKAEQQAIIKLQAQLAQAEQAEENASKMFKDALKSGRMDPLFKEAVDEARDQVELSRTALNGAQQRLAGLRHEIDSSEFNASVKELFDAFANKEDTPAMRAKVNRFLESTGLQVTLDAKAKRVGMSIGDGPIQWQPLDLRTVQVALTSGTTSAKYRDLTITDAVIEKAIAAGEDPGYIEWMRSMKGVPQTAVTSLPPGWQNTEIGKAMKGALQEILRENPAEAELIMAMNGKEMTAAEIQAMLDAREAKEKAAEENIPDGDDEVLWERGEDTP